MQTYSGLVEGIVVKLLPSEKPRELNEGPFRPYTSKVFVESIQKYVYSNATDFGEYISFHVIKRPIVNSEILSVTFKLE